MQKLETCPYKQFIRLPKCRTPLPVQDLYKETLVYSKSSPKAVKRNL